MVKTKLFLDCEFTGLHQKTTLISIGLVSEDNRTFYAEFTDYDINQVDPWIQENIINKLQYKAQPMQKFNPVATTIFNTTNFEIRDGKKEVKNVLYYWLELFDNIEIWSDCLAYDWVLFCELFGGSLNLPKHIYYIPFDICTLFEIKGIDPDINREDFIGNVAWLTKQEMKHNALWDALVIKACYEKLVNM